MQFVLAAVTNEFFHRKTRLENKNGILSHCGANFKCHYRRTKIGGVLEKGGPYLSPVDTQLVCSSYFYYYYTYTSFLLPLALLRTNCIYECVCNIQMFKSSENSTSSDSVFHVPSTICTVRKICIKKCCMRHFFKLGSSLEMKETILVGGCLFK